MSTLPKWAETVLDSFAPEPPFGETEPSPRAVKAHEALVGRVQEAWPALSKRLVQELSAMRDGRAREVFGHVVLLLKYFPNRDVFRNVRQAKHQLSELNDEIERMAVELATLYRRKCDLVDTWELLDESPDMLECLERWHASAQSAPEFAAWAFVADDRFRKFLLIARTQSWPRPGLAEFLDEVAAGAGIHPRDLAPQPSRKSTSDLRRALLEGIDRPDDPDARSTGLTHEAVADLLTALFDDDVTADDVRKLRGTR